MLDNHTLSSSAWLRHSLYHCRFILYLPRTLSLESSSRNKSTPSQTLCPQSTKLRVSDLPFSLRQGSRNCRSQSRTLTHRRSLKHEWPSDKAVYHSDEDRYLELTAFPPERCGPAITFVQAHRFEHTSTSSANRQYIEIFPRLRSTNRHLEYTTTCDSINYNIPGGKQ